MGQLPDLSRILFLFATKSAKLRSSHMSSCSELPIFMSSYGHEKQPTRSIIAHLPYSSAKIALCTALVLTHNVLKCHHSVRVQCKPYTSSHFSFQNIGFGVNKDIREDIVLMASSRIHAKISGSKANFQSKSQVVFLGTVWQIYKAAACDICSLFCVKGTFCQNAGKAWDKFSILKQIFKQGCVERELMSLETNWEFIRMQE